MINLAANVSMLFGELAFPDRFAAAAAAGFTATECQFPYSVDLGELERRARQSGTEVVLINAPPGDLAAGDRGLAAVAGREAEFRASIDEALRYAEALGCPRVHVMAGVAGSDGAASGTASTSTSASAAGAATARYVDRLGWAADRLATAGIDVMIEPLNQRDFPGYLLSGTCQAQEVIAAVGRASVRLQFDTYHLQILEGDLWTSFQRCREVIGHVQIAAVPDRGEPDAGEVDHDWLRLDDAGYDGWVGAEYRPRGATSAGLAWARRYGVVPGAPVGGSA